MLANTLKPRALTVQQYYYRLHELNTFVEWLPGTKEPLDKTKLKLAFHDSMPAAWREHLVTAGKSHRTMTQAKLNQYFRVQEQLSIK